MYPKVRSKRRAAMHDTIRQRLQKTLMILLYENCQAYSWYHAVHGFVRSAAWRQLYNWADGATTVVYSTAAEHFAANQIAALVLKAPLTQEEFGFVDDSETAAFKKFVAAEDRCRESNRRLSLSGVLSSEFRREMEYMRRWILSTIGETPDLFSINDKCGFSSGAALGVHGNATNLYRKFFSESGWSVSPTALPYAIGALCSNEQFLLALCDEGRDYVCVNTDVARSVIRNKSVLVAYNKVEFVPKTAKTDRSIAVEPLLNSYLQKGIDSELRSFLLRRGYDLSDQSRNGYLAMVGSRDGSLCTLDLSSASDSISIELARRLLPEAWFDLLNRTRSPSYLYNGEIRRYEKFVSMGNGFCFPLQTLLFASAVRAALSSTESSDWTHAVYGDDIIVPASAFNRLVEILEFMGFVPNSAKSFSTGPFRESCGADWYEGQDVRPVYLDYPLWSTSQIMIFHNATLRSYRASSFFEGVREYLRELVPRHERFYRPFENRRKTVGKLELIEIKNLNGAFDVPWDLFMGSKGAKWHRHEQRWGWKEFLFRPVSDSGSGSDYHLAQYWAFLQGSLGGELYLRRKTTRSIINR